MDDVDDIIADAIGGSYKAGRLVTFGESYIVLSADGRDRLERASFANIAVGGPELNCSAAYACLDLDTTWVSTVADSAFGRRKLRVARAANIDTRFVSIGAGRTGLKFVDAGQYIHAIHQGRFKRHSGCRMAVNGFVQLIMLIPPIMDKQFLLVRPEQQVVCRPIHG